MRGDSKRENRETPGDARRAKVRRLVHVSTVGRNSRLRV
jgi:hypothetical protein